MSHHYLSFENVSYTYPDGTAALKSISFLINHVEKVAIIGANGAGKSTLIMHTNGLLLPDSGTVNVGNIKITKQTLPIIRQSVGLVFQNADDQLFMPTVYDDVAFGVINMNLPQSEIDRRGTQALNDTNSYHLKDKASYQLSGGQKRNIAIATVLAMEPNILVMDEPTANLDSKSRRNLINLIKSFSHTCIIATHDLDLAWEICPRTIIMANGSIIADGSTRELLTDTNLLNKTELEQPYQARYPINGSV